MRNSVAIGAVLAPLMVVSALAQEAETEPGEQAEPAVETPDSIVREQGPNELRVDWITGTTVQSPQQESIGSIEDVILDEDSGQLSAAILSVGGFLGFGAKQIAVDWEELQIDYDAREITLDITRAEAEAAPDYEFRDRETLPAPAPATGTGTGTGTTGTGTGVQ